MIPYILLTVILVVIDQVSKAYMVEFLSSQPNLTFPVIEGFFHFTYVRNPGVVFGIGGDAGLPLLFFIVTGLLAIGIFSYYLVKTDFKDKRLWVYHLGLALLIAGAAGNLIDRVVQVDHRVIDFLDFRGIWGYIFNVADMCLSVGITVFLVDQLLLEPKRRKPSVESSGTDI